MLRNLDWLEPGQPFPPIKERPRVDRYRENEALFDGEHFGEVLRERDGFKSQIAVYQKCSKRISQVIGNFEEIISFPVLLNYQRLISLKMADLVCGEYPSITGASGLENEAIKDTRDYCDFDAKLYSTAIDISRFGDALWRIYLDDSGRRTFTCWDPKEWYPIVSQDGTNTITDHVLCWRVNRTADTKDAEPDWQLHVQIHPSTGGYYTYKVFKMEESGSALGELISESRVTTGLDTCAVLHIRAFGTSTTVYGYDDYMTVDSVLAEIMARIGQISVILDKHADPNITGPATMLSRDPYTGEYKLSMGKFFATSVGENEPKYMTWDGQLNAAFSQLEFLVNQLYIISEMGAAILGGQDGSSNAISGTAMRFKMVNPLAKARRIANSLSRPVRRLFSELSKDAEVATQSLESGESLQLPIPFQNISIFWSDGLPDDPRENVEICKLATGEEKMMPLKQGIMEYFGRSDKEAQQWITTLQQAAAENMLLEQQAAQDASQTTEGANNPGPQDGTGVNPQKKGSETGLASFHSYTNGEV